jgi:hypothetical protein
MISRCPSCGAPAPDEARQCPACDWDFVGNKKGVKGGEPAKPPAENANPAPPAGLSLPPARPAANDAPAAGLGMARLPKIDHAKPAASGEPADANPFALPVARNLGPKPGEGLFSVSAPKVPEPKMPEPKEPEPKEPEPKEPEPKAPEPKAPEPKAEMPKPPKPKLEPVEPPQKTELDLPAVKPPEARAAKEPAPRSSGVYLAATAGAALGLLSIAAIFVTLRSDPPAAAPPAASSPFGKRSIGEKGPKPVVDDPEPARPAPPPPAFSSPPPVIPSVEPIPKSLPAPEVPKPVEPPKPPAAEPTPAPPVPALPPTPAAPASTRPTATFAQPARVKAATFAQPAHVKAATPRAAPKKSMGPQWEFEGTVYDLLTTRGVFGVQLVFVDADDYEIASVGTGKDGHYRVAMKAGPPEGYTLRIVHDDYSGKHIDELDSTSSVRKADLEQRKFLMQAGARSLPWVGKVDATTRRDMALVPKVGD